MAWGVCGASRGAILAEAAGRGSAERVRSVEPMRASALFAAPAAGRMSDAALAADCDAVCVPEAAGRVADHGGACGAGMFFGHGYYVDFRYAGDVVRFVRQWQENRLLYAAHVPGGMQR